MVRVFSNTGATACSCIKQLKLLFTKMRFALELAEHDIRVICRVQLSQILMKILNSGIWRKNQWSFPKAKITTDGKPGTSEQVAQLVFVLASDASSHITGTEMVDEVRGIFTQGA